MVRGIALLAALAAPSAVSASARAAGAFREMADSNGDGRVSPDEFRAARSVILSRY